MEKLKIIFYFMKHSCGGFVSQKTKLFTQSCGRCCFYEELMVNEIILKRLKLTVLVYVSSTQHALTMMLLCRNLLICAEWKAAEN